MTRRHWITVEECKELYNVRYPQLQKLVEHKVLATKKANKVKGKGRAKILYNHNQVKVYGKLNRAERRQYMARLNGTTLGRKPKNSKNQAAPKRKPQMIKGKKPITNEDWQNYGKELYDQVYTNWKQKSYKAIKDMEAKPADKHISVDFNKKVGNHIARVNQPEHYNPGKIPVIDAIEDWELNFSAGNVVKYLVRAGRKNSDEKQKDLQKALWYLIRMLKDE